MPSPGSLITAALFLPLIAVADQPSAPKPIEAPLRDLELGEINFLHTTDIHGWAAGHLREPSYSADYGDYISFTTRMRENIEADDNDLLVIDTGDRVEGNGLYDGSTPKGHYYYDIIAEQHFDVISTGNHELYRQNTSLDEFKIMAPKFGENYVTSNVRIKDPETGEVVSLGHRYRKFKTKKRGIRVAAFGFLYDFVGNSDGTIVQPVEDTIREDWFLEAVRDRDIDLFLVIGHAPLRSQEFEAIFKTIREAHWDVPIQFFGGHLHVRDYKKYDSKAAGLASGRFMETVGFQSIKGISKGKKSDLVDQASVSFSRRYIDNNLYSYYHHTGLDKESFPTSHGVNISRKIKEIRSKLDLDSTFGCAPKDLWMTRAEYPSDSSIYSWLEENVLPDVIVDDNRVNASRLAMINTGSIRFDILKGPFTRDSTFIISPFTSGFRFVKDVPYEKARKILNILNNAGPILQGASPGLDVGTLVPPEQRHHTKNTIANLSVQPTFIDRVAAQLRLGSKPQLTPGYTTKDDGGSDGDDTVHEAVSFYKVPNVIQSVINPPDRNGDPDIVDLVFIDFIQPWILLALKFVGLDYSEEDTEIYMKEQNLTTLIAKWVSENWKDNC